MKAKERVILVVEEQASSRKAIVAALEAAGYFVYEAGDIKNGLSQYLNVVPHCLVLDADMPNANKFIEIRKTYKGTFLGKAPIILSARAKEKELLKLAKEFGAKDTIGKPTEMNVLLQKALKIAREMDIDPHAFKEAVDPKVKVRSNGRILMANEVGVLVESPFKIASETRIELQSSLLEDLGCYNCVFKRSSRPSRPGDSGRYLNDVAIIGLSQTTMERIRDTVKNWK